MSKNIEEVFLEEVPNIDPIKDEIIAEEENDEERLENSQPTHPTEAMSKNIEEVFLEEVPNLDLIKDEIITEEESDEERLENVHKCNLCPKSFPTDRSLKAHYITHIDDKPHECIVCFKAFKTLYGCSAHYVKMHMNDIQFPCTKKRSNRSTLVAHLETHAAKRNYDCPHCPKSFSAPSLLKRHLLTHSDEKRINKTTQHELNSAIFEEVDVKMEPLYDPGEGQEGLEKEPEEVNVKQELVDIDS